MKRGYLFIQVLFWGGILSANAGQDGWTWLYGRRFSASESIQHHTKSELVFSRHNIPLFSQLILSWNALRPKKGYFSFWVSAHNHVSDSWYSDHHLLDWGATMQRSYCSIDLRGTGAHHVRLEVPLHALGDGFRIKIKAHDGADLAALKGLFVSVSNMTKFNSASIASLEDLPTIKIERVPCQSQMVLVHDDAHRMCSPTAMSMLLGFLQQQLFDPLAIALRVYDAGLETYGNWQFNAAQAFEACGGSCAFCVTRLSSFAELHKQLARNIPVMVSVRGAIKDAPQPYPNGHLLLVVGWDNHHKKVICHDPAFDSDEKTAVRYGVADFLSAWGRSHNLAYIADPASYLS